MGQLNIKIGGVITASSINTSIKAIKSTQLNPIKLRVELDLTSINQQLKNLKLNFSGQMGEATKKSANFKDFVVPPTKLSTEDIINKNTGLGGNESLKDLNKNMSALEQSSLKTATAQDKLTVAQNKFDKSAKSSNTSIMHNIKAFTQWYILGGMITGLINSLKNVVTQVMALDKAMVELNKVSDLTKGQMQDMTDYAFRLGTATARMGTEVLAAITEFKRAGFELEQSKSLAKYALMLTNVAEGIKDTGTAANYLISILKGANLEVSYASKLLDSLNEISNNSAVGFDALADMTQRIAGTMNTLGNSVEETMALVTGAYEVLQDTRVAKGISIIGLRIAGLNEDLEEEAGLASKVGDAFKKYANIDVMGVDGQLKDTFDILEELAGKWDTLSKNQQTYLLTEAAGKNRADVLSSLMKNWEGVAEAMEQVANSAGSAEAEQAKYLQSVEAKVANIKNSFQELANTTLNSDVVKGFLDATNAIIKFADGAGGLLPIIGLLVGGLITLKAIMNLVSISQQKNIVNLQLDVLARQTQTAATQQQTVALTTQKVAMNAASVAAKGLAIAMGAITAVATIVISVISAINQAEAERVRQLEKSNEKTKENIENLKAQRKEYNEAKDGVERLETEQKSLRAIENKTADQKKNLTEITNDLAKAQERLNKATGNGTNVTGDYSEKLLDDELEGYKEYERVNQSNYDQAKDEEKKSKKTKTYLYPPSQRIQDIAEGEGADIALGFWSGQYSLRQEGTEQERADQLKAILDKTKDLTNLSENERKAIKDIVDEYTKLTDRITAREIIIKDFDTNKELQKVLEENKQIFLDIEDLSIDFSKATQSEKIDMVASDSDLQKKIASLEKLKETYPQAIALIDSYIKGIKEEIKAFKKEDLFLKSIDKDIEKINKEKAKWQETQDALKKEKEEQEKILAVEKAQLAVEKAREALAKAKDKRIMAFRLGKGMVEIQDVGEIEKAQEDLNKSEQNLTESKEDLSIFMDEKEFSKRLEAQLYLKEVYDQALADSGADVVRQAIRDNEDILNSDKYTYDQKIALLKEYLSKENRLKAENASSEFTEGDSEHATYKKRGDVDYNESYSGKTRAEIEEILKTYPTETETDKKTKQSLENFLKSGMKTYHTGGIVGQDAFKNNQELFAKLKIGEVVLPQNKFQDIIGKVKTQMSQQNTGGQTISIGNLNLPNVNDVQGFILEMKKLATPKQLKTT